MQHAQHITSALFSLISIRASGDNTSGNCEHSHLDPSVYHMHGTVGVVLKFSLVSVVQPMMVVYSDGVALGRISFILFDTTEILSFCVGFLYLSVAA